MNEILKQDLMDTCYVHAPLPLHRENSLESSFSAKKVLAERSLWRKGGPCVPENAGPGETCVVTNGKESVIRLTAPLRSDHWPEGAAEDGDYSNFGSGAVRFDFARENWEAYNRISFQVKPEVPGGHAVHLNLAVFSDGRTPIPDKYFREGATVFDLKNHEWNQCYWEFSGMPRDAVTHINFYVFLCGQDTPMGESLTYDLKEISLQRVEDPEPERGWLPAPGKIIFSTAGYWVQGAKTAVTTLPGESFQLLNAKTGEAVFSAPVKELENERGAFHVLDFSEFNLSGNYRLRLGNAETKPFPIGTDLLEESLWKAVNFLYCERCGAPVANRHGACHFDMVAEHNGLRLSYAGGWHDAGDVSQQTAQTGEVTHALFEAAENVKHNPMLYKRVMEEARWGLEFVLRTRFGDGHRATSAGATRWTDGKIGNMDDVAVRVHNYAFENFLFSGIEAYAAYAMRDDDPDFAWGSLKAAREDFAFAQERFASHGMEQFSVFEHTYNSSLAQHYAVIVWAASNLYLASHEETYAQSARQWAEKLMACQETGDRAPLSGFFYRDEQKKSIVHFCHQSREQQFIQALELLCRTQPESSERDKWERSMQLYGGYLKALRSYTEPYGMIPAGIYRKDEPLDEETFSVMHIAVRYEEEKENYRQQLAAGIQLDENFVIRRFPVWFSFRGNTAVHLAMGKAASLLGRYFHEEELLQIGREQIYWVWGKNPFGQSLQYGVGSNYVAQYAVLPGEAAGEMPVGIETLDNEDIPYWPQNNNATFKEVWTSSVGRWLWLAADYLEGEERE